MGNGTERDGTEQDGDVVALQAVLDALDDPNCRTILRETSTPKTARELSDTCEIPKSTLYRKLDLLTTASLVRELLTIDPERGRIARYQRDFDDVVISMDGSEEFDVTVDRSDESVDDHLVSIWSDIRDEA